MARLGIEPMTIPLQSECVILATTKMRQMKKFLPLTKVLYFLKFVSILFFETFCFNYLLVSFVRNVFDYTIIISSMQMDITVNFQTTPRPFDWINPHRMPLAALLKFDIRLHITPLKENQKQPFLPTR